MRARVCACLQAVELALANRLRALALWQAMHACTLCRICTLREHTQDVNWHTMHPLTAVRQPRRRSGVEAVAFEQRSGTFDSEEGRIQNPSFCMTSATVAAAAAEEWSNKMVYPT